MNIVVTADPYLPVPPRLYGGIERVIDLLVRGLIARGHSVTLLAHPGSTTPATLVGYGVAPHFGARARLGELAQVASALWRRRDADVVHSFGRLAALLPILPLRRLPKVQSYQRPVPWRSVETAARLAGRSLAFTGCSASLYRGHGGDWRCIFNAVDPARYRFSEAVPPDAPLVFLGRVEALKGAHHAIAIARAAGRELLIAGNRVDADGGYFEREIAPRLDSRTRYLGAVDDAQKDALLGGAAALLMPIEWEEPFGIVMAEALACGTPVIAFARGAAPEVVRDGENGFLCDGVAAAAAAVARLGAIDRARVRRDCEARFGADRIVSAYEALYRELVERCAAS